MCRCERCCPDDPGPTYTEAHRLACLARSVLGRSLEARREFLALFEQNNWLAMTVRLKDAIWQAWDAQRRAA